MARQRFTTMGELFEYHYGADMAQVGKADAPVLTTTTGVFNPVFGAIAFSQLNNEANVFGLLPKYPWQHSGWRAITADAGATADGGVAENGAVPDTAKPTFAEITVSTKQVAHAFEVSYIQEGKVKSDDDALADMEMLRGYNASLHAKRINEQLCVDGDTLAGVNFESIDRVTASSAYASAVGWTAADEDIYGIDRSANSWADAFVSHASGVDRAVSDALIRSVLSGTKSAGGRTNLIITGNDTLFDVFGLYQDQVRYMGILNKDALVEVGINGVSTGQGLSAGMKVATLYGIPMFASQAVPQDTKSRMYFLDTTEQEGTGLPRLGISLMYPTLYFESGMSASRPDPFAVNKFGTEGVYYTAGELVCVFLAAQGSLRDLL